MLKAKVQTILLIQKTTKMSLANIQGKLSRAEMKNIMAGSGCGECLDEYSFDCSSNAVCCSGFSCVRNGTNTGTICMKS
jgi:hypothetical protein